MGSVVQVVASGAALIAACVAAACAALVAGVLLTRSLRRRRSTLDAALTRSREEVESLTRKVEELSQEVRTQRIADREREYVITSLAEGQPGRIEARAADATELVPVPDRAGGGKVLEDQLVRALGRKSQSPVRSRWVDLAVGAFALGHGVRRALSADVLDRAAAEAHVARRRSRRERRRQVRHARRQEVA